MRDSAVLDLAVDETTNVALRRVGDKALISRIVAIAIGAVVGLGSVPSSQAATAEPMVSFQKQVFPIFQQHCVSCHSEGGVGEIASSLDLTTYKELRMGSIGGVALIPFHAANSPIMRYLKDNWKSTNKHALKMPPVGPQLSPQELDLISRWIDQGAKNN